MADENTAQDAAGEEQSTPKGSKKVLLIVVAIMVLETIGVGAFLFLSGGGPSVAEADLVGDDADRPDAIVEVQLVADRFQNTHTGRVWQWDTEVFIQVQKKDEEKVTAELERRTAEITAGVGELIRKATHTQLREPDPDAQAQALDVSGGGLRRRCRQRAAGSRCAGPQAPRSPGGLLIQPRRTCAP